VNDEINKAKLCNNSANVHDRQTQNVKHLSVINHKPEKWQQWNGNWIWMTMTTTMYTLYRSPWHWPPADLELKTGQVVLFKYKS